MFLSGVISLISSDGFAAYICAVTNSNIIIIDEKFQFRYRSFLLLPLRQTTRVPFADEDSSPTKGEKRKRDPDDEDDDEDDE